MTTISPTKRRILGTLNPNASPCPGSRSEFEAGQLEEIQTIGLPVLPAECEKDRGQEESARKRVCLDLWASQAQHQHQHQHQQTEAAGHRRRNQSRSASPPTESMGFLGKSAANISQSAVTTTFIPMEHETTRSQSVLPALHPTRVAAEGAAFFAPMATQIAYPAGLVENCSSHKQPKRATNSNSRLRLANQAARQVRLEVSCISHPLR